MTGTITTYLEMTEPGSLQVTPPHRSGMLLEVTEPEAAFQRYLAAGLGDSEPRTDEQIVERLTDEAWDLYVLYLGGVPAATFELDRRNPAEIELVSFGVMAGFEGRGLGKFLLASAVETAWRHGPERIWVRDPGADPRRILLLQWAGFVPYRAERDDPTPGVNR